MRTRVGVRSLRHEDVFPAVRAALSQASKPSFRVVHFSVQVDHLHLIVESADKRSLSLGLRGLAIRVARAVNRALGRNGRVWGDRYHARALPTPREVRHGLVYVLMNFRKHLRRQPPGLDPCSSAAWFDGFRAPIRAGPADHAPVSASRTWLGSVGWRRHGLIDVGEHPRVMRPRS